MGKSTFGSFGRGSVLTPEVCSLNPVISKISNEHLFIVNCIENTIIKKNRPGMAIKQKFRYHYCATPTVVLGIRTLACSTNGSFI